MSQFYMICFDVADPRRLRRIANELENYGQRVQRSVFECWLDDPDLFELKRRAAGHLDMTEDQIRYYRLCAKDVARIIIDGPGTLTGDISYTIS
ncbi:CRISPR-associated endonuclease Cas2 [bacterium endosymbiont of Escarpia laminata]|nr:MAG: CRISPR-associated endonuclease Cas2 [bacterium endosymbiont of Escarpia laminata]